MKVRCRTLRRQYTSRINENEDNSIQQIMERDYPYLSRDLILFLTDVLNYSIGVYSHKNDNLVMVTPIQGSIDVLIKAELKKSIYSSRWCVIGNTRSDNNESKEVFFKDFSENETLVLIPACYDAGNEEKIFHERGVGRDVHFTFSTLISLYFLSIDATTLHINYATNNFIDEYNLKLPWKSTLLDLCCIEKEKKYLQRLFNEVGNVRTYTLRFTFHSRNPKRGFCCFHAYCIMIKSYYEPVMSLIDYTVEEKHQIIAQAVEETCSDQPHILIVCNAIDEVIFMSGSVLARQMWEGKTCNDVISIKDGIGTLKGQFVQGPVRYLPLHNGSCIVFRGKTSPISQEIPVLQRALLTSLSSTHLITKEEQWIVAKEIIEREGTLFALYKESNHFLFSSRSMQNFLHDFAFCQKGTTFRHPWSPNGRILTTQVPSLDCGSRGDLFQYLAAQHIFTILSSDTVSVDCPEIHATVHRKILELPSLFVLTLDSWSSSSSDILPEDLFLVQEVPFPILFLYSDLTIQYMNEEAMEQFGHIQKAPFSSILSPQSIPILESICKCSEGESSLNNFVIVKNKEYMMSLYHTESQYRIVLNPIHNRIMLKRYLHLSLSAVSNENIRYRTIFDVVFDGTCIIELQSLTILNPSYSLRALLHCEDKGTILTPYIAPAYRDGFLKKVHDVCHEGVTVVDARIMLIINHEERMYSIVIVPVLLAYHVYSQAVLCIKDITENEHMKQKQKELQRQVNSLNALRQAMIDVAFSGSCLYDMVEMKPLEFIHPMESSLAKKMILSESPLRFYPDVSEALQPYFSKLKQKRVIQNVHVIIDRGTSLHLQLSMVFIPNESKAMMSFRDITKDVEREENEIKLREEAETANRNKRDFIV